MWHLDISHILLNSHNCYSHKCMLLHLLQCMDNSHILLISHKFFAYFLCEYIRAPLYIYISHFQRKSIGLKY